MKNVPTLHQTSELALPVGISDDAISARIKQILEDTKASLVLYRLEMGRWLFIDAKRAAPLRVLYIRCVFSDAGFGRNFPKI